ncbi:MAG: cardiolipin synthase [Planctomycetota bacterium]|nr:MAG: cardiolipin synthase [Planctomycetota bacterium]
MVRGRRADTRRKRGTRGQTGKDGSSMESRWAWWLAVAGWTVRVVMFPVIVLSVRRPTTCLAWLAVVFFEPWVGAPLYALLGGIRLGRRRLEQRVRLALRYHPPATSTQQAITEAERRLKADRRVLAGLAQRVGGLPPVSGNAVTLTADSQAFVDQLIADIDAATDHAHLLFYIYRDDYVGRAVSDALIRAAARGVTCRVLVDAVGARPIARRLAPQMQRQGVQVVFALPANVIRRRFARIDVRNHRKIAVIDGRIGYTGSQNIVEPTYGHRRAGEWHDIMARIRGPAVNHLQQIFVEDWFYETGEPLAPDDAVGQRYFPVPEQAGETTLQVIPTGPDRPTENFSYLMVEAIHQARRRVVVTSPYFVPDEPLFLALKLAALRGLDVRIILPKKSDHPVVHAAAMFYCRELFNSGVRILRYRDGLLHAKTLTTDERFGFFGTANFDIRSFHLNFEVNVQTFDPDLIHQLLALQEDYIRRCDEMTALVWHRRPRWKYLAEECAKLLSPLL